MDWKMPSRAGRARRLSRVRLEAPSKMIHCSGRKREETTLRMQMRPSGRGRPGRGDGLVFLCGRDQHRGDKWREVMSTGTHWNPHVKRRLCEAEAIGASAHAKSSLLCSEAAISSLSEKGLPSGGKASRNLHKPPAGLSRPWREASYL